MANKQPSSSSVLQQPLAASNVSSQVTSITAKVQEMHDFPSLQGRPLPTVHVNNASLGEIKLALDEAVKKVCVKPLSFVPFRAPASYANIDVVSQHLS
jgi:hypothetical protein